MQMNFSMCTKKSAAIMAADVSLLHSAVADAAEQLTVLGHHNKQILLHKITSR
jgi:hypothetical protein